MASLESYERLKRLYGIRNRFWARNLDELAPLLRDAHERSLVQNHKALLIALRSAQRSLQAAGGGDAARNAFYRSFVRAFQYLRRVGPFSLQAGQRVALLSQNDHVSLTVRNVDGSLDAALRRRLLQAIEPIAERLAGLSELSADSQTGDDNSYDAKSDAHGFRDLHDLQSVQWARSTLLSSLPLEAEQATTEVAVWDEIAQSPAGQLLSNAVPGFPLLMKLFQERKRLQDGDWKAVAGEILGEGARSTAQGMIQYLLMQMKSGAQLAGPLSFLFGVGVDRTLMLKKQGEDVDAARKRIEGLLPLYRQYHKNG